MNRYMVQVVTTHGNWINIAGNITLQPVTDAFLGGSGVIRGENYRIYDRVADQVIEQGIR